MTTDTEQADLNAAWGSKQAARPVLSAHYQGEPGEALEALPAALPAAAHGLAADYAWATVSPAALHAYGVTAALRYVSRDGSKGIHHAEARQLHAGGIRLAVVFEDSASRALSGHAAGVADAELALALDLGAGASRRPFIFFACDWDAGPAEQAAINDYFAGAGSVLGGPEHVGGYGGYWPMMRAHKAGRLSKIWQTSAWSNGLVHPAAVLYQFAYNVRIGGVDCDLDRILSPDFGEWGGKPGPVSYLPVAVDGVLGLSTVAALQDTLNHKPRAPHLVVDGQFGPGTRTRLEHYLRVHHGGAVAARALQKHVGAKVDGVWGPDTTLHLQRALNAHKF